MEYSTRSHPNRTYGNTDGPETGFSSADTDERSSGPALTESLVQTPVKNRTFSGSVSHLGESNSYQGTGSVQFPGDQDLRFTRVPLALHSVVGQPFLKSEGNSNSVVHTCRDRIAKLWGAGTGNHWGQQLRNNASVGAGGGVSSSVLWKTLQGLHESHHEGEEGEEFRINTETSNALKDSFPFHLSF